MGELNETGKGKLQATGLTPEGTKDATSQDNIPETLTRVEYQKLLSDERAKAGRELKVAKTEAERYKTTQTQLESELNTTKERMGEIQRRIDEADEEEARGSPESLKLYQRQKQLRDMEARLKDEQRQLERERTEHAAELVMAKEARAEMSIISAAVEYHVDIGKLKEKCQLFNLTTEEQISELAETLAGQVAVEGDNGKKKIPRGDSGRTIGGIGLGSLSPKERLAEINKRLKEQ